MNLHLFIISVNVAVSNSTNTRANTLVCCMTTSCSEFSVFSESTLGGIESVFSILFISAYPSQCSPLKTSVLSMAWKQIGLIQILIKHRRQKCKKVLTDVFFRFLVTFYSPDAVRRYVPFWNTTPYFTSLQLSRKNGEFLRLALFLTNPLTQLLIAVIVSWT